MPKPPNGTPLNTGHALASGLIGCWLLNEGSGSTVKNLVTDATTSISGGVWATNGSSEPVLRHDTTTDKTTLFASSSSFPTSAVTIVLVKYRKTDATLRASGAIGTTVAPGTATFGALFPYTNGHAYFYWGGSGSTNFAQANSVSFDTTNGNTWIFTAGSRGLEIWRDNSRLILNATYVPGSHARVAGTSEIALGKCNHWSGNFNSDLADYEAVLVYDRQLTTVEIASITSDPYQMIGHIVLNAPTGLTAEVGDDDLVITAWTDTNSSPNESGAEVQWARDAAFTQAVASEIIGFADADNLDIDTGAAGIWYVRVRARGDGVATEHSPWSSSVSVEIPTGIYLRRRVGKRRMLRRQSW